MHYKSPSDKFSGDDRECWEEVVSSYDFLCENYELTDRRNMTLLHVLVQGNAMRV